MSNWERTVQLIQWMKHSKLQEPPFSYAKLWQTIFEKWHIPNNYFDSAFLGTTFSQLITNAKCKGYLKNETFWHLGNCPNSAEAPHFTQQGPLKIHRGSTGCLCSLLPWMTLTVAIYISPLKNSDSSISVQIWGLPSLRLRLFQHILEPILAPCAKAFMTSQIFLVTRVAEDNWLRL